MLDDLDFGNTIQGFSPGQKLSKRYSLNRTLGEGGMGVVWLVRDEELKRDIAMKFLPEMVIKDREAIADLKRETNRSLELTHSNIVRIYDFVQEANWAGISMEYVDGETLSALKIEQPGGCFDAAQLAPFIQQLCQALSYAHEEAHVVHRDLKPTNLMVTKSGKLKVTDFGIAGTLTESISRVTIRASSGGTLVYMSPQQAMGEQPSVTDDIYSLGATLYDLLTGKPPFYSGDVMTQLREKPATSMTERRVRLGVTGKEPLPQNWEDTILACLEKDPANRPQSVREVAEMLARPSGPAVQPAPTVISNKTTAAPIKEATQATLASFERTEKAINVSLPIPDKNKLIKIAAGGGALVVAIIIAIVVAHHGKNQPLPPQAKVATVATPTPAPVASTPTPAPVVASPTPQIAAATPTPSPVVAVTTPTPATSATPAGPHMEDMDGDKVLQLAQNGDAAAQGLAALWYSAGYKLPQDYKQAAAWAQKSSDANNPIGQVTLALLYMDGAGVPKDETFAKGLAGKGIPSLAKLDDEWTRTSLFLLARTYQEGLFVGPAFDKPLPMFENLADFGNAMGQYQAGLMLANGQGPQNDTHKAPDLLQQAANAGLPDAMLALGLMYQSGNGVAQDAAKSADLWQQAADKGSADAQLSLANKYAQGDGVKKDMAKATQLYQQAADQNDAQALYQLGWLYAGNGIAKDSAKSIADYQAASNLNFGPANAALAIAYAGGDGVTADTNQAGADYEKASVEGLSLTGTGNANAGLPPQLAALANSTNSANSTAPSASTTAAAVTLDPQLITTWENADTTVAAADRAHWKIVKGGAYTITTGTNKDAGIVTGAEGVAQKLPSDGSAPTTFAYAITGGTLETYDSNGYTKWKRGSSGDTSSTTTHRSNSSGDSGGSRPGIGHKIKNFFHL